ncbi:glycoside hydrolase [Anaeromyces robustus]|uniref:Glycoside hydrolase n=1 Tax=Anaeromyces robustus TaxID=1754192 RepID=A0A1Y1XFD1_9FUNG|nr:glycoside hydrolase [Anaeromyces robustus]|eukprot:ORX84084.1 glycoside hydrolase [Anaeromyces robustus]
MILIRKNRITFNLIIINITLYSKIMIMIRIYIAIIIYLSFSKACKINDISSINLIKNIRLGWNFGNALDVECTNWTDFKKDQIASERCWGNIKTTENIFNTLINNGFNLFRIPITWTSHIGSSPNYIIDQEWLVQVREIVNYSYHRGAYVIINSYDNWINIYKSNLEKAKSITKELWKQIAEEFKDYDEHLLFEVMNKPGKMDLSNKYSDGDYESWNFINEINKIFINTVRNANGNNPKRHLLITPYTASFHEESINHLYIPINDNKIIVSINAYVPYNFTYNNSLIFTNTSDIDWLMNTIKEKLLSNNIATIITEFGAVPRKNNDNERIKWAKYFITKASKNGIPCSVWDNGLFDKGNNSFGLIDRNSYTIKYPDYMNILLESSYLHNDNFKTIEYKNNTIKNNIKETKEEKNKDTNNSIVYKRKQNDTNIIIKKYDPNDYNEQKSGKLKPSLSFYSVY